jgi:hypothetical protein
MVWIPQRPPAQASIEEWLVYCDWLRPAALLDAEVRLTLHEAEHRVYRMLLERDGDPLERARRGEAP